MRSILITWKALETPEHGRNQPIEHGIKHRWILVYITGRVNPVMEPPAAWHMLTFRMSRIRNPIREGVKKTIVLHTDRCGQLAKNPEDRKDVMENG